VSPSPIRLRVATNIRQARRARKLSQEELGYRAGIHRTYVGAIERAETNVTIEQLQKLAEAMGLDPIDLMHPLPMS
jgi:transcriptional regulator with XRE-family HTH domain